jgi:hypothetical protein
MAARIVFDQPGKGCAREQRVFVQAMRQLQGLMPPEQRVAPGETGEGAGHAQRIRIIP